MPEFRHQIMLHEGVDGLVRAVLPTIEDEIAAGTAIMVAAQAEVLGHLASALGARADRAELVDISKLGANPGRLIDLWNDLVGRELASARPMLGISQAVWPDRDGEELAECEVHEHLVNRAFAGHLRLRMICPFDVAALPASVVNAQRAAHPHVLDAGVPHPNDTYRRASTSSLLGRPLPPPPADAEHLVVTPGSLADLRRRVREVAAAAGLEPAERIDEVVLAASEIGANSVLHGGGAGDLSIWSDADALWCEVTDDGTVTDPLIGRRKARDDDQGGRGIWIAHQVCDLVQVRSGPTTTRVRLRMRLDPATPTRIPAR